VEVKETPHYTITSWHGILQLIRTSIDNRGTLSVIFDFLFWNHVLPSSQDHPPRSST